VGGWGSQVDVGWEVGTAGDGCVLMTLVGYQRWGGGSGLEDGLPRFTRSSEVLGEPHRVFLGPQRLAWSLLRDAEVWLCLPEPGLEWRAWKEGDWERGGVLEQPVAFPWVPWPKLAKVPGVA